MGPPLAPAGSRCYRCSGKYRDRNFPFRPLLDRVFVRGDFTSCTAQTLGAAKLLL